MLLHNKTKHQIEWLFVKIDGTNTFQAKDYNSLNENYFFYFDTFSMSNISATLCPYSYFVLTWGEMTSFTTAQMLGVILVFLKKWSYLLSKDALIDQKLQ